MNTSRRSIIKCFSLTAIILLVVLAFIIVQTYPESEADVIKGNCGGLDGGANLKYKIDGDTLTVSGYGPMASYGDGTGANPLPPWYAYRGTIQHLIIDFRTTTIGSYAFLDLTGIFDVSIPSSVSVIGTHAFDGCTSLAHIFMYHYHGTPTGTSYVLTYPTMESKCFDCGYLDDPETGEVTETLTIYHHASWPSGTESGATELAAMLTAARGSTAAVIVNTMSNNLWPGMLVDSSKVCSFADSNGSWCHIDFNGNLHWFGTGYMNMDSYKYNRLVACLKLHRDCILEEGVLRGNISFPNSGLGSCDGRIFMSKTVSRIDGGAWWTFNEPTTIKEIYIPNGLRDSDIQYTAVTEGNTQRCFNTIKSAKFLILQDDYTVTSQSTVEGGFTFINGALYSLGLDASSKLVPVKLWDYTDAAPYVLDVPSTVTFIMEGSLRNIANITEITTPGTALRGTYLTRLVEMNQYIVDSFPITKGNNTLTLAYMGEGCTALRYVYLSDELTTAFHGNDGKVKDSFPNSGSGKILTVGPGLNSLTGIESHFSSVYVNGTQTSTTYVTALDGYNDARTTIYLMNGHWLESATDYQYLPAPSASCWIPVKYLDDDVEKQVIVYQYSPTKDGRAAPAETALGTSGLTWGLYDSATTGKYYLKISGTGVIPNMDYSIVNDQVVTNIPWYSVRDKIDSVIISQYVTGIGNNAFRDLEGLERIRIPAYCESIGDYAFAGCDGIELLQTGAFLKTIGAGAFKGCTSLGEVILKSTVTTIGAEAFSGCSTLASATLYYGVTSIGARAFQGCPNLADITIYSTTLTSQTTDMFDTGRVTLVKMDPAVIQALGPISGSTSGTRIIAVSLLASETDKMGENIYFYTNDDTIYLVGYGPMFENDNPSDSAVYQYKSDATLTKVWLSASITTIGKNAFATNPNIASVEYESGTILNAIKEAAFKGCTALPATLVLPDSVLSIGDGAYYGTRISSFTPGPNLASIGTISTADPYVAKDGAFESTSLTSLDLSGTVCETIGDEAFKGLSLVSFIPYSGMTAVGVEAFKGTSLTSLELSSDLSVNAGKDAFADITTLKELTVHILTTHKDIFAGDKYIEEVHLISDSSSTRYYSDSETYEPGEIQEYKNTPWYIVQQGGELDEIKVDFTNGSKLTMVPRFMFYQCTILKELVLPGTGGANTAAFYGCTGIQELVFDGTSTSDVMDYAFAGMTNLKNITIPYRNMCKFEHAFDDTSIEKVTLVNGGNMPTDTATTYAYTPWAKSGADSVEVVLEGTPTTIPEYLFYGSKISGGIVVPEGVTTIGTHAFDNCDLLTSISMPDSLTSIGANAFYDCDTLTEIVLRGGLTTIGASAFQSCDALQSVVIPGSVTTFGNYALDSCSALEELYLLHVKDINGDGVISDEDKVTIGTNAFNTKRHSSQSEQTTAIVVDGSYFGTGEGQHPITGYDSTETTIVLNTQVLHGYEQCGSSLFWKTVESDIVDGEYTLIFFGMGTMFDTYTVTIVDGAVVASTVPWYSAVLNQDEIDLDPMVDPIYGYDGIVSAQIPEAMTKLGNNAFAGLLKLSLTTNASPTLALGNKVLYGCDDLAYIEVPEGVKTTADSFTSWYGYVYIKGSAASLDANSTAKIVFTNGSDLVKSGKLAFIPGKVYTTDKDGSILVTSLVAGGKYYANDTTKTESDDNVYTASTSSTITFSS